MLVAAVKAYIDMPTQQTRMNLQSFALPLLATIDSLLTFVHSNDAFFGAPPRNPDSGHIAPAGSCAARRPVPPICPLAASVCCVPPPHRLHCRCLPHTSAGTPPKMSREVAEYIQPIQAAALSGAVP